MELVELQRALGAEIRRCRLAARTSQESFAESVGVHRTYVGSVERGERNLSLGSLLRIAAALETQPAKLLAAAERSLANASRKPRGLRK